MSAGAGYQLTDHACRYCGGRVLQSGLRFRCGGCGSETTGSATPVCGCGIHPGRAGKAGRFRCVRNAERSPANPAEIVIEFYADPRAYAPAPAAPVCEAIAA